MNRVIPGPGPILYGSVRCGHPGCVEMVACLPINACTGCGEYYCPRHLYHGTWYDGEVRSWCFDCQEPSDPLGPVA
jgi:hypothetical protein